LGQFDVLKNLFDCEIGVLVEMFRKFVLLLFGQQRFLASIAQSQQLVFAALLIFFEPMIDRFFVDEQCVGDFGDEPTACRDGRWL